MQDRFFESARGKIIAALRGRRGASAFDLAAEFGLSPNAIRQQLIILERDGLVSGQRVRRGKTKPTVEYALTPEADKYFPQHYDQMLNAVLREIRQAGGDSAVRAIFDGMAKRSAERLKNTINAAKPVPERAIDLTRVLRASGVDADVVPKGDGFALTEHNCPYSKTVTEHPEVCNLIHGIMHEVVSPDVKQTESLATGGRSCRFEVT
ncbi:MAG: helix-turn-helix domain-containing protein [Candidatus Velthaea sp.]|jgi:predicted ArsR family transcriptional regulator